MANLSEAKKFLSRPFDPTDVEWRVNKRGYNGQTVRTEAMPYISSRAIMDRLDEAVDAGIILNWEVSYTPVDLGTIDQSVWDKETKEKRVTKVPVKGLDCSLSIAVEDKNGNVMYHSVEDGADLRAFASFKSAFTDSIKRAAVNLGIGRYLYKIPMMKVEVDQWGKFDVPKLPAWALPDGYLDAHAEYGKVTQSTHNEEDGLDLEPFTPTTHSNNSGEYKFRFKSGKYAGKSFDEINDKDFLNWVAEKSTMSDKLKAQARQRIEEL